MGADIHGWVEVQPPDLPGWDAIIRIRYLTERAYRVFALLFGLRNSYGFTPLAAGRGWPADMAPETTVDSHGGAVAPTWALWKELKTVDWQAIPERVPELYPNHNAQSPLPRASILPPGWEALFKMMEVLAVPYGDEGVRMVIWFDQE